jgi:serine/threonine-protein kinase
VTVNPAPPVEPDDRDSEEFTARTELPPPSGPASRDLARGTTLNEYTIENKIGEGGMGSVFSAVHPLIGKRAAVKVLKKELCEDPITLERFIDEARVVNQIGHPNIVDVFAFGTLPDGRSYFIMEWLKGETLRERIERSGRLNYIEAAGVLKALARALEAAHEKDIIHRDLKPDNVFLIEDRGDVPRVKLLDFGIAKLVRQDQSVSRTATGAMIGTPQYVAPEQAKGHAIDARVDIYSLGCVAFELVTGRPPFVADNAMEMVAKHLMEPPPHPSQFGDGIPKELDELIVSMLSKDREERPTLTEITGTLDTLQKTPAPRRVGTELGKRDSAISLSVTRPVDVVDLVAQEHRRRKRRSVLAAIGLVLGGVATGAIAFMVVSSLRTPSEQSAPAATPPPTEPAVTPTPTPTPTPEPVATPSPDAGAAVTHEPAIAPTHAPDSPKHPPAVAPVVPKAPKLPPKVEHPKPPVQTPPKPPNPPVIKVPNDDRGLM